MVLLEVKVYFSHSLGEKKGGAENKARSLLLGMPSANNVSNILFRKMKKVCYADIRRLTGDMPPPAQDISLGCLI